MTIKEFMEKNNIPMDKTPIITNVEDEKELSCLHIVLDNNENVVSVE